MAPGKQCVIRTSVATLGFSVVGAEKLQAELSGDVGVGLHYCCYLQPPSIVAHLLVYRSDSPNAFYWRYHRALELYIEPLTAL